MKTPGPRLGTGAKTRGDTMTMLRLDGFTTRQIADHYGCSRQNVEAITKSHGLKIGVTLIALYHNTGP